MYRNYFSELNIKVAASDWTTEEIIIDLDLKSGNIKVTFALPLSTDYGLFLTISNLVYSKKDILSTCFNRDC